MLFAAILSMILNQKMTPSMMRNMIKLIMMLSPSMLGVMSRIILIILLKFIFSGENLHLIILFSDMKYSLTLFVCMCVCMSRICPFVNLWELDNCVGSFYHPLLLKLYVDRTFWTLLSILSHWPFLNSYSLQLVHLHSAFFFSIYPSILLHLFFFVLVIDVSRIKWQMLIHKP